MIELQGFAGQLVAGASTTLELATTSLVFGIGVGFAGQLPNRAMSR